MNVFWGRDLNPGCQICLRQAENRAEDRTDDTLAHRVSYLYAVRMSFVRYRKKPLRARVVFRDGIVPAHCINRPGSGTPKHIVPEERGLD
jgi:hypothetical protein